MQLTGPVCRCGTSMPLHNAHSRARASKRQRLTCRAAVEPGSGVLVVGATGGVGQILTSRLAKEGYQVKALVRNMEKAEQMFGDEQKIELLQGDMRDKRTAEEAVDSVSAICCAIGTTAFPSGRWAGNNGPEQTDYVAVKTLLEACPSSLQKMVYCSSAGVTKSNKLPFAILNLGGVLKHKKAAEDMIQQKGIPYTIFRLGRLTDGPYTSFDLNTLLQATAGSRQDVKLSLEDDQTAEASRIAAAEACLQSLRLDSTNNMIYSLTSQEGEGPGQSLDAWRAVFAEFI